MHYYNVTTRNTLSLDSTEILHANKALSTSRVKKISDVILLRFSYYRYCGLLQTTIVHLSPIEVVIFSSLVRSFSESTKSC